MAQVHVRLETSPGERLRDSFSTCLFFLIVGASWNRVRVWLWVPAFAVMGAGCLANAVRCGRIHCYVTGPLFLLAAVFVALSGWGIVALHPGLFLLVVFGTCCLALCAEILFGKYRRGA